MRKQTLLITVFLFLFIKLIGQPTVSWDKTYGGSSWEQLNAAVKTADGGFLLCGSSSSPRSGDVTEDGFGDADFWVVRIDSFGNKIWDKRFGGSEVDICMKAIQNPEGFLLIGFTNSGVSGNKSSSLIGERDIWLIQIRPDGSKVWEKTLGGEAFDEPFNGVRLADGGYIIAAHSNSPKSDDKTEGSKGGLDLWLLRVDNMGNRIWDKTYGGSANDEYPTGLTQTRDGNFLVACGSMSSASGDKSAPSRGGKDYWILKFSESGALIWERTIGGNDEDAPFDIQELKDGSFIIGGNTKSDISGDKKAPRRGTDEYRDFDYWLMRIEADGKKIVWERTFGGIQNDNLTCIDQNKTGYFLVAGQSLSVPSGNKTDSLKGSWDFWVLYLNENGDKIWEKNIGGDREDVPFEMIKFRDGSYLVCGGSRSNASFDKSENNRDNVAATDDMWVVKIVCLFDLDIGNDTIVCKLRPITLNAEIPQCRNCLYEWSTGEKTPAITINPTQTTKIRVKVTANNACVIADDIQIILFPNPELAEYLVKPPKCHNGNDGVIALDSVKGGSPPYFLVMGRDTFQRQFFIDKLKAGDYRVSLVDRKGCKLDTTINVPNPTPFSVFVTPNQELVLGDSFRLSGSFSKPIDTFFWNDSRIRVLDTILKPFNSQNYTLTAVDKGGCRREATTQIIVRRDNLFFAPTAFAPQGTDNRNNRYQIYGGSTVVSIKNFKIFNRWGEMMYGTNQIFPVPAEGAGWDGQVKGRDALPGVYVYWAEIMYIDGRKEIIKGDFVLFR